MTVGENIEVSRAIYAKWERGEFTDTSWARPEIVFGVADGPEPLRSAGIPAMMSRWLAFERSWESLRIEAVDHREVGAEQVLTRTRWIGRTRGSELDLSAVPTLQASLMRISRGKVVQLLLYWHAEQALADLGLAD